MQIIDPGARFLTNWHIDLIAEYLEAAYAREIRKLAINIPPRSLKSNLVSVAFPAWVLGQDPREQFLCASYSGKLSIKHSVDCRAILESAWYQTLFPGTQIADDQNEKSKYSTTQRGYRVATSTGGTATGDGGNFLILDDPLNPKQAMSETERASTNEFVDQTWSSRKNDPSTAVEILVMQRLHQEDPTGHLVGKDPGWELLKIPQEAEGRTVYSYPITKREKIREDGELLHPERWGPEEVADMKTRLGSYGYAAQQQQNPAPKGGGVVKLDWFRRYSEPPARPNWRSLRISIDTAFKPGQLNDPSVAGIWATTDAGHFLLDVWRDRVGYPDLKRTVKNLLEKWRPNETLVEDKASGQSLIQDLRSETNWPIIPMEPTGEGDKLVRMSNESPAIEAGLVWLPETAPWLHDFELEVSLFPNAANDDQVDQLSQFLRRVREPGEIFIG
jgi:predicted phage terminase large subunit-like protein